MTKKERGDEEGGGREKEGYNKEWKIWGTCEVYMGKAAEEEMGGRGKRPGGRGMFMETVREKIDVGG